VYVGKGLAKKPGKRSRGQHFHFNRFAEVARLNVVTKFREDAAPRFGAGRGT